jgi:glycosyltransferase involved in cell wall biosynthesis
VKLNWFSPVPPTPSAIAVHTAAVLPSLAKQASITLWVHEPNWSPELEEHACVRRYNPEKMPWTEINAADATIYHLGNQPEFHGPIWQVSRRHPGIVVLHDLGLQHLFAGLVVRNLGLSPSEYCEMMRFHYPDTGPAVARAFLSGERNVNEICEDCPLTEAALENAVGVAVHTQAGYSLVASSTTLPVSYIPLFASPAKDGDEQLRRQGEPNENFYRIIIFGFLTVNRRLESILKAFRDFPQKHRFHLDIYGTFEKEESILQMINAFQLKTLVTVHGFVPAAELSMALSRSDLAINLRNPTMGEASASQLRIWQHGLPSLVTDTGWYATVPKNTVAIVRRDAELEDIQAHLANFLRDPETYREVGRNGRRYVEEHHTIEAYVCCLLDLVKATLRNKARQAVFWISGRSGRAIRPWFSEEAAEVLLPRLAQTISDLFDEDPN